MHQTGVDLTGLLSVVSDHLYSTPLVAVRELVQNAHDSITRRQFEDVTFVRPEARIDIAAFAMGGGDRCLFVRDTGAGLTEPEIHQFLATIGSGYTRRLREQVETGGGSDLIGLFGIGFLSAFVIAEHVEVITTSYQTPNTTLRYVSSDGQNYDVTSVSSRPVGTTVQLRLKEKHASLADARMIASALTKYATLLIYPIYVRAVAFPELLQLEPTTEEISSGNTPKNVKSGGDEIGPAINAEPAPWRDDRTYTSIERRQRDLAFASRFEHTFEPIVTMPVTPLDGDSADARGLLWIQDGSSYGTSDNRNLSVFVRRMLLDDDARDLLPRWAGFVGGAIESSLLTPTASREDLQRDSAYEATKKQLASALIDGLQALAKREPDSWRRVLRRHNNALIGAALADDRLFALLADQVKVPTSEGELNVRDLVHRETNRLHVTLGVGSGFEDMLLRAQKIPVAKGEFFGVLAMARRFCEANNVELVELGSSEANRQMFMEIDIDAMDRAWLAEHLAEADEQTIPVHFEPTSVPLVAVPDREAELKRLIEDDDADARISVSALKLARMYTEQIEERPPVRLFVNLGNPAIRQLLDARRHHHPGVMKAVRLLRSVKSLLTPSAEGRSGTDVADALDGISETVTALLAL